MPSSLLVALNDCSPLVLSGAVRVRVLSGVCSVLGAVLQSGYLQDVVCPLYQSSLTLHTMTAAPTGSGGGHCAVEEAEVIGGEAGEALVALRAQHASTLGSAPPQCILCLQAIPELAASLDSYDVESAGFALQPWSMDIPGALITLVQQQQGQALPPRVVRHFEASQGREGGGAGSGSGPGPDASSPRRGASGGGGSRCRAVNRIIHPSSAWEGMAREVVASASGHTVPTVFVSGPSGSGKSTFARYLVNALLSGGCGVGGGGSGLEAPQGVAFLDLDLGQPEHTPPGCLSLSLVTAPILSPPHLRTHHCVPRVEEGGVEEEEGRVAGSGARAGAAFLDPLVSSASSPSPPSSAHHHHHHHHHHYSSPIATIHALHFLGSSSPKDDPTSFSTIAASLITRYRQTMAPLGIPLVVNSHGWTKGLGFELLSEVLTHLAPSHTVLLHVERPPPPALNALSSSSSSSMREEGGGSGRSAASGMGMEAILIPPARAWQPTFCLTSSSAASSNSGLQASIPSITYRCPAWHFFGQEESMEVQQQQQQQQQGGGGKSLPPRAARSPPDQRAARFLVYFMSNLRFLSPAFIEGLAGEEELGVEGEGEIGVMGGDEGGEVGGDGGEEDVEEEGEEDDDDDDEEEEGPSEEGGGGMAVEGGGSGVGGELLEEEEEEEEEGEEGDEDGEGEEENGGDAPTPATTATSTATLLTHFATHAEDQRAFTRASSHPLQFLHPALSHGLYWRILRRQAQATFLAILNDSRVSRTPCSGLHSPAFLAHAALALKVPHQDVHILASPSESIAMRRRRRKGRGGARREGGGGGGLWDWDIPQPTTTTTTTTTISSREECEHRAMACVGHLVALCGVDGVVVGCDESGGEGEGEEVDISVCATNLPCLGLGYVRHFDRELGVLHILSPLPMHLARLARVIVPWLGAPDLPSSVLFRSAPEGDPGAFHPKLVLTTAGGGAAKERKQLKRKRLVAK